MYECDNLTIHSKKHNEVKNIRQQYISRSSYRPTKKQIIEN